MRALAAGIAGFVLGAWTISYVRRYLGAFAWWAFTRIQP